MAAQTVSKGLSTWAGLIAAAGQYAGAVAVFLNDPDKATALGPLTTATVTLVVVIAGRMKQSEAAILNAPIEVATGGRVTSAPVAYSGSTGTNTITQTTRLPLDPFRRAPDIGASVDDDDEPGDPDALPDYETTTVVPPDEGDRGPGAS